MWTCDITRVIWFSLKTISCYQTRFEHCLFCIMSKVFLTDVGMLALQDPRIRGKSSMIGHLSTSLIGCLALWLSFRGWKIKYDSFPSFFSKSVSIPCFLELLMCFWSRVPGQSSSHSKLYYLATWAIDSGHMFNKVEGKYGTCRWSHQTKHAWFIKQSKPKGFLLHWLSMRGSNMVFGRSPTHSLASCSVWIVHRKGIVPMSYPLPQSCAFLWM